MLKLSEKGVISSTTRPCEYFDMIAGTSTGGLIAILLGRLGLSVEECIQEYESLAIKVFGKGKRRQAGTAFSATTLKDVIRGLIKQKAGYNEVLLSGPQGPASCPM
jgi:patatin-like phospholipase/acyl hydrolase